MRRLGASRWSRGLAAVEMALVLPAALLLIFGLIETGNLFFTWLTVQKAAEMGARFAATGQGEDEGTRVAQIQARSQALLVNLSGSGAEVSVRSWPTISATGSGVAGSAGEPCGIVEVGVSFLYRPVTPLLGDVLPESIPVHGSDRKVNEPWRPCPS